MSESGPPTFGIVIPVYKHSELVMEALDSALAEARDANGVVLIVNDGCPFPQTHDLAASFAESWPRHVGYLRTPNGGLSAARNRGIRHLRARFPELEAIYLLDADNRLHRGAMRRALRTMRETGAAWVYPPIDMFGIEAAHDFTQPYGVLRHLFENLCEAGSLVHRGVFDAGIYFDEAMRLGWEDWEFWLRCAAAGFRGAPCADFGLQYRTRRESMLRDSDRDAEEIRVYMRKKHKPLFAWRNLLRLEQAEAPRFLCVDADAGAFQSTSAPAIATPPGNMDTLAALFWRHEIEPTHVHFPAYVVHATAAVLAQLAKARLLDWVFWQIQDSLADHDGVRLHPRADPDHIIVGDGATDAPASIVAVTARYLSRLVHEPENAAEPKLADITLTAPFDADAISVDGAAALRATVALLRASPLRPDSPVPWEWRAAEIRLGRDLHAMVAKEMRAAHPWARTALTTRRELAIVLPLLSFGGVEQVALQVATQFRAAGWSVRLVITASNRCDGVKLLDGAVDSVAFLNDPAQAGYNQGGARYFGHNLQSWSKTGRFDRLVGLLAGCAAVITFHAIHANEAVGWLRRNGAVTATSLHVIDLDPLGAPSGIPYLELPYEHAFDLFTTPSRRLEQFCAAAGIPAAKLLRLPNAPTFVPSGAAIRQRLTRLAEDERDTTRRPPRVLYLGRLDRQKGFERLLGTIRATAGATPRMQWRVIGGAVIQGGEDWTRAALAGFGITAEAAIYDRAVLSERLLWADVLLLPSRWEGSPLIVLEAQSLGAVPLATDVGAVDEMIADGETGVLARGATDAALVVALADALRELAQDRARLARLSRQAMAAVRGLTWERVTAPLLDEVERLADARGA